MELERGLALKELGRFTAVFDPSRSKRVLVPGTPDPSQHPCHPAGTWQRALLYLSLGYALDPADSAALEAWHQLSKDQRRALAKQTHRENRRIVAATNAVLARGEIATLRALSQRVAKVDGMPGYHRVEQALLALVPLPGVVDALVYRAMVHAHRPVHVFSTSRKALTEYVDHGYRDVLRQRAKDRWAKATPPATPRKRDSKGRYLPMTDNNGATTNDNKYHYRATRRIA